MCLGEKLERGEREFAQKNCPFFGAKWGVWKLLLLKSASSASGAPCKASSHPTDINYFGLLLNPASDAYLKAFPDSDWANLGVPGQR